MPRRPGSRRRRLAFALAAVGIVPGLVATAELGLRVAGWGASPSFVMHRRMPDGTPVYATNPRFGWRFFPARLAREPQAAVFVTPKPAGTFRVVVLGESAAMGDPDVAYGLSRVLQVQLGHQFPDRRIEVVNAAVTAINSHAVVPIARDCARRLQPDAFVVYMGNNEVVGPFGAGSVLQPFSPSLPAIRLGLAVKSLRIGQWLDRVARRLRSADTPPGEWDGMAMFLEQTVAADDPRLETVYAHFRRNLDDALDAARKAGAATVLCTVAVNLRDCAPFAGTVAAAPRGWAELYSRGMLAEQAGDLQAAYAALQQAATRRDDVADLHYRLGRLCGLRHEARAAASHFARARDLDRLRFRTDSRLNAIIREAATRNPEGDLRLVDAEQLLAEHASGAAPGEDLFYDHVHLNFRATCVLARAVAAALAPRLGSGPTGAGGPGAGAAGLSDEACATALAFTDWSRLCIDRGMLDRQGRPPFTQQLDHEARLASLVARTQSWSGTAEARLLAAALDACRTALEAWPDDPVLHASAARLLRRTGNLPAAAAEWQTVGQMLPFYPEAVAQLGNTLGDLGDRESAKRLLERARDLDPACPDVYVSLGYLRQLDGDLDAAERLARQALALRPSLPEALNNLATLQIARGQTADAMANWRAAVRLSPRGGNARGNLANALAGQGRMDEALALLREGTATEPGNLRLHLLLGDLLLSAGRPSEARDAYRVAVQLAPSHPGARQALDKAEAAVEAAAPGIR